MRAVKVWEFPVRVVHWINFLAITGLCLTGAYIHFPFLATATRPDLFAMGYARIIHFTCGWALMASLGGRFLWGLVGNKYARLSAFFPFLTAKGREGLAGVLKYYAFLEKRSPPHMGHNELASLAYLGIYLLMLFQVVTGFALFSQSDPNGTAAVLFGWVFSVTSNGWVRLAHYFSMFLFMAFFIFHMYAMWISAIAERDGSAGSMFDGYKYGDET